MERGKWDGWTAEGGFTYVPGFWSWKGWNSTVLTDIMTKDSSNLGEGRIEMAMFRRKGRVLEQKIATLGALWED